MPQAKNRQFLDFERPIKELFEEIEKLKQTAEKTKVDLSGSIRKLEDQVLEKRREITQQFVPVAEGTAELSSGPALYDEVYR